MQVFEQLSATLPQKTRFRTTAIFSYSACFPKTFQIGARLLIPLSRLGQASHATRGTRMSSSQISKSISSIFPPNFLLEVLL